MQECLAIAARGGQAAGPKTVTVALSAEQFHWLKQAISNQREVWDMLMQLQQLTAPHALDPRRKRLSKKCLGLN